MSNSIDKMIVKWKDSFSEVNRSPYRNEVLTVNEIYGKETDT